MVVASQVAVAAEVAVGRTVVRTAAVVVNAAARFVQCCLSFEKAAFLVPVAIDTAQ